MWAAIVALEVVAAALAWRVEREQRGHRPLAVLVCAGLAADLIRQLLAAVALAPWRSAHAGERYRGALRALFHLDEALFLLWPVMLAAVSCLVFLERARGRSFVAVVLLPLYLFASLALTIGYPTIRGGLLAHVFLGAEICAAAVCSICAVAWWRRRERPTITTASVLVLGMLEAGVAWRWKPPGWDWQSSIYVVAFSMLIALHACEVWVHGSRRAAG